MTALGKFSVDVVANIASFDADMRQAFDDADRNRRQTRGKLKATTGMAVCEGCDGIGSQNCAGCKGTGLFDAASRTPEEGFWRRLFRLNPFAYIGNEPR